MSKIKNCKILLLLLLFALSAQNALGTGTDYWMYLHIQVDCYPTGSGKVYASTTQSSAQNSNNCTNSPYIDDVSTAESYVKGGKTIWYVNTVPTDASKWAFKGWVKDATQGVDYYNTTYVSTDRNPTEGFKDPGSYASSTADGKGGKVDHNTKPYYYPNPFPITLHMTAVYESIKPDVIAVTNNGELGATEFSEANNSVGETVILEATPSHYNSKFEGWYKDGVLISKENPFSFTITNENKGTYTARFVEHKFMRIKNSTTNRYINGVNDQGSITNFSSLQLEGSKDATRYQAGTVIYLWDYTRTNPTAHPYVFDIQGFSSKTYYKDTKGEYVTILHNNESDTWTISDKDKSYFMTDKGGISVELGAINAGFPLNWEFEHIDNDLSTCENYFSLDPAKLVQVGDKYYTTLRTSWNILFNPEQMTPYVVTSADEETGTFEMEPITGNIIPLGTPVIIETKNKSIEENRMVPTTTAFTGTKPATNLLQTSEKYFPNQSVSGNYKALMVNGDGQLAFGGTALGTVNGNEAYLQVDNEVVLKPADDLPALATLKTIESSGEKGKLYVVEDELIAVAYAVNEQDNSVLLWCKDQAESNQKTTKEDSQFDYMKDQYVKLKGKNAPESWDQSNWVALKFVPNSAIGIDAITARLSDDVVGHCLNPKAVTGTYSDDVNYTITVAMPQEAGKTIFDGAVGKEAGYQENLYCTANFLSVNLNAESAETQPSYYFVNPKIQEVAEVTFAVWNGSCFVAPAHQDNFNAGEISGAFNVDWGYNNPNNPILADNQAYQFLAVVQRPVSRVEAISPKDEVIPSTSKPDGTYMVFPLNLDPSSEEHVITSVAAPVVSKTVSHVIYYNLMGVASAVPFQGVNIVVTEYSDGTRQARKMVKR
jgi:hypothetical protein